ncbi:MAG: acyl-ACP--UDP-N-acetylglucosamine O-acyltransferase [Muribaculaceae bacterium]|nr:acyl-ACP--UDP-N-acetylglucosamine O-acyltransferase [Muribaculaceae bacterium]MBR5531752.1 acyl-ACP--UDP-N-acetylglucosamine O-acyltransferase [Bacteroidales bacterium]
MQQSFALIHPDAKIGKDVIIGPFVTIEEDVIIGEGTRIDANACILKGSRIGKNCHICSGAVIAGEPQDLKFNGEYSTAEIGDNTTIREFVTINRGTASRGKTVVGNNCLIMAYSHIAHDCILKNNIIVANATQIAGEVEIDNFATIGGGTLMHQFSKIGAHVMIQGGSHINKDIPPYAVVGRIPTVFAGINLIGLRRRGFSAEQIENIQNIYRIIYYSDLNNTDALSKIMTDIPDSEEKSTIIDFIKSSDRGIVKGK